MKNTLLKVTCNPGPSTLFVKVSYVGIEGVFVGALDTDIKP